ncbi:MAG: hypothetical protein NC908_00020, partial [Candidatus Omnitrophica bacterium]|nr:hypothetical protein [Candidatus Omnitrophota bacterium]
NLKLNFVSGTLYASQLSQLWTEVTYDGKTEYWKLHPSMLTTDGKSIVMIFSDTFAGKTLRIRFYAFDLYGKQTQFTNYIDIYVR